MRLKKLSLYAVPIFLVGGSVVGTLGLIRFTAVLLRIMRALVLLGITVPISRLVPGSTASVPEDCRMADDAGHREGGAAQPPPRPRS